MKINIAAGMLATVIPSKGEKLSKAFHWVTRLDGRYSLEMGWNSNDNLPMVAIVHGALSEEEFPREKHKLEDSLWLAVQRIEARISHLFNLYTSFLLICGFWDQVGPVVLCTLLDDETLIWQLQAILTKNPEHHRQAHPNYSQLEPGCLIGVTVPPDLAKGDLLAIEGLIRVENLTDREIVDDLLKALRAPHLLELPLDLTGSEPFQ